MKDNRQLFLPLRVFASLRPPYSELKSAKVVILPVPYDSTTTWRSGTRYGPQSIIDASQYLELYDLELDREIYKVGIHTLPEVEPMMNSPEEMVTRVYLITKELVKKGKFVVGLGGEHSLTLGTVRAFKEAFPKLSVLQLDAHADLRDKYLGTRYSHACVMRRIHEICPIAQVGIRSLSQEEKQFITQNKLSVFYMPALTEDKNFEKEMLSSLSADVYVTIDVDAFDPSIMPAVGTPEPGGLQWQQVLRIIKLAATHKHIVGFDLMEFCPEGNSHSCAFSLAKLAYKFIGYITPPV
jgi:agmatinase